METIFKKISRDVDAVLTEVGELPREDIQKLGGIAMDILGDYPIYGCTSNLTYEEAIIISALTSPQEFKDEIRSRYAKLGK